MTHTPPPNPAHAEPEDPTVEDIYIAPSIPEFDLAEAITSILIGLGIEGQRELIKRLQTWEEITHSRNDPHAIAADDIAASDLRYAIVGYLLETQKQTQEGVNKVIELLDVSSRLAVTTVNLMLVTVSTHRLGRFLIQNKYVQPRLNAGYNRFDYLVERGERELRRWQARGQLEDLPSRAMARHVVLDSLDEFIDYLSQNEQIARLVQEQSMGLAGEVITEAREYSVSADNALESIVRRLLRRPPRPTTMDIDASNAIENEASQDL